MGKIGGNALAILGLSRTVVNWAGAAFWALAVGTMVLVARGVGAGDEQRVRRTVVQAIVFTFSVTLVVALVFIMAAEPLLLLVGRDAALARESVTFLRLFFTAMVMMVMIYLVLSALRGAGEAALAMRIQVLTNSLQAFFTWAFIFGPGPFPVLGVLGVPAGIALSRVIGVSATMCVFLSGKSRVRLSLSDFATYKPDFGVLRSIISVSVPNAIESIAKSSSRMVVMRIVASSSAAAHAVSAYTVGSQIESLYDMIGSAFSTAAATSVGQNLGADRPLAACVECNKSVRYGVVIAFLIGVSITVFAVPLMGLFTQSEEVVEIGIVLLRFLGVAAPFYMMMVTYAGGLKGAADTRSPMVISIIGSWLVQIPFACAAVTVLGLNTTGIWLSEALNYSVQGVVAYLVFRRGAWMRMRV